MLHTKLPCRACLTRSTSQKADVQRAAGAIRKSRRPSSALEKKCRTCSPRRRDDVSLVAPRVRREGQARQRSARRVEDVRRDGPRAREARRAHRGEPPRGFPYAERAANGRAHCRVCDVVIAKGELRVAFERVVETGMGMQRGPGVHAFCMYFGLRRRGEDGERCFRRRCAITRRSSRKRTKTRSQPTSRRAKRRWPISPKRKAPKKAARNPRTSEGSHDHHVRRRHRRRLRRHARHPRRRRGEVIAELAAAAGGGKVLELGIGTGRVALPLFGARSRGSRHRRIRRDARSPSQETRRRSRERPERRLRQRSPARISGGVRRVQHVLRAADAGESEAMFLERGEAAPQGRNVRARVFRSRILALRARSGASHGRHRRRRVVLEATRHDRNAQTLDAQLIVIENARRV